MPRPRRSHRPGLLSRAVDPCNRLHMSQHHAASKNHIHQAQEALGTMSDPGYNAITLALVAVAEAVLESGHDISHVRDAVQELDATVSKLEIG
jgi:hypothetical protein